MTDVEIAKKRGEDHLKIMITTIQHSLSYDETAYHLPISFALTGIAVHDKKSALDVFARTSSNPLVASECILAEITVAKGKEPAPYTGFIDDTVIRKLGTLLLMAVSLDLHWLSAPLQVQIVLLLSAANCRKNTCSRSLPAISYHHYPAQG